MKLTINKLIFCTFFMITNLNAASLKVCNNTEYSISTAVVYFSGLPLISERYTAEGWWNIPVGECYTLIGGYNILYDTVPQYVRLIAKYKNINGKHLMYLANVDKTIDNKNTGSSGTEDFICVKNAPFTRNTKKLSDHTDNCPEGYYLHFVNLLLKVYDNYTLTLN